MIVRSVWPATVAQTPDLVAYLSDLVGSRLSEDQAGRILLCAVEAFNNISLHGQPGGCAEDVIVTVGIEGERGWVRLEDRGPPFNPILSGKLRALEETRSLSEVSVSGRGLALIHHASDCVCYAREGPWNRLTLTVLQHEPPPQA